MYLSDIALNTLAFLLLAALALFFQVIANNKFMGYLLIVLFFVSRIALGQLYFEHHLYSYGSAPGAPYSDMNGYGHFLAGHLWFRAYWLFFALGLMVVAALYWPRGTVLGWRERSRTARERFRGPARALVAVSVIGFIALGVWIFYNTNVLNRYVPSDVAKQNSADYEKKYRQYKDLAAAEDQRRQRERRYLPARAPRRGQRQIRADQQDRQNRSTRCTCVCRST